MTAETKQGMPAWAKVLIGLAVLTILGAVGLFAAGAIFFQNVMKQAQEPAVIARVAKSIAAFAEPIPDGYRYSMGIDVAGIKSLTVEHEPDRQLLIITAFPKKENLDAQTLVNQLFEKGINVPAAGATLNKVKSKGSETIAGETMPYILGTMTDKSGNSAEGLVACIVSQSKNKTLFIYGIQPVGTEYNLKETMDFLKAIKSI